MSTDALDLDEHRYWKAAISHLPTQQQRDAAWEFFVHYLAQNPKMADTFSGIILVMQANGLFMLEIPRLVQEMTVASLGKEILRLRDELSAIANRHTDVAKETLQICETANKTAETAGTAVRELDDAIRQGWREVDTEKLAQRVHSELEETLFLPLAAQCREIKDATPELKAATEQLEKSARQLRAFHFRGILLGMVSACLLVTGGCWWYLTGQYDRKLVDTLRRLERVDSKNQAAFTELDLLGASIRVAKQLDSKGKPVPGNYALVLQGSDKVVIKDSDDGNKMGAIFFRSIADKDQTEKYLQKTRSK